MKRHYHKIQLLIDNIYSRITLTHKNEMLFLASLISLYVFRMSIPHLKVLFLPILAIFIVYSLLKIIARRDTNIIPALKNLRWFVPFGITTLFFLLGVFLSDITTPLVIHEMQNIIVLFAILLFLIEYVRTPADYEIFKGKIAFCFLTFSLIISILGLTKFYFLLRGVEFGFLKIGDNYPWGSSLMQDYNFFSLGSLLGIAVLIFYYFRRRNKFTIGLLYHMAFLLMFYNIIWSGSRRGFISLLLLAFVIISLRIFFLIKKQRIKHPNLIHNLNILILTIGFSVLSSTYFFKYVPFEKKDNMIEKLALDNSKTKIEITKITYRHLNIFKLAKGLNIWYDKLWGYYYIQTDDETILPAGENPFSPSVEQALSSEKAKVYYSRFDRWRFASDLFLNTYTTSEKIFGGGFDYLLKYKSHFSDADEGSMSDYPHNNIISAYLYSGIIGGTFYLMFLAQVLVIYIRHRKELVMLLPIFLFITFFAMVSGNSIFSIPVFAIFTIFPIHYAYIVKGRSGII